MKNIFNHLDKRKFAIYIGERLEEEGHEARDAWFHSFLMLVDETTEPVQILQQLHYNDDVFGNLLPNTRLGIAESTKNRELMAYPLVGGAAEHVLNMWNAALQYAHGIKHLAIPFGKDYRHDERAVNCRSAVVATLKSIGLETYSECFAQAAGLACEDIMTATFFNHLDGKTPSPEKLQATNAQFAALLEADWVCEKRYVGPIIQPFRKMEYVG